MKQLPKDIKVEIEYLDKEHGGREKPALSGYRPQFFYNGQDWDAAHEYIGSEKAIPGEKIKAYLTFLSPQEHNGKLYPSMPFLIREGNRTVGFGVVLEIIDLAKSAKRLSQTT